jgi:hypothetical protein
MFLQQSLGQHGQVAGAGASGLQPAHGARHIVAALQAAAFKITLLAPAASKAARRAGEASTVPESPTIITVPAMAPPVASALEPAAPVRGADAAGKSRRSTSA